MDYIQSALVEQIQLASPTNKVAATAEANAALTAKAFVTMAKRAGMDARELWDKYALKIRQGKEMQAGALGQPLRIGVDAKAPVNVVDLTHLFPGVNKLTATELQTHIQSLAGKSFRPADNSTIIEVLKKHATHIAYSGAPIFSKVKPVRNASIKAVDDLIEQSVLIETVPNTKKKPIEKSMSEGQKKKQHRKTWLITIIASMFL